MPEKIPYRERHLGGKQGSSILFDQMAKSLARITFAPHVIIPVFIFLLTIEYVNPSSSRMDRQPWHQACREERVERDTATMTSVLRQERERRNWTQEYVAEQIGAPDSKMVGRWERGTHAPSLYYRQELCRLFGLSAKELGLVRQGSELIWNVPYRRNPFFTGRQAVLEYLHETLTSKRTAALTQTQAISGLGGIGKTQTAVEYTYRYQGDYPTVLWARADSREVLVSDFVSIAGLLNLPEQKDPDQSHAVNACKRWLNKASDWLLILDNVEVLAMVNDFLPPGGKGHILLTTRAQATGAIAQRIELEQMESEEGALFLLRRAKLIPADAQLEAASAADSRRAKEIVEMMGGLPLALDQAAAYIEETECGLEGYLERYLTRHRDLLRLRGNLAVEHPEPVATTWSLSFEKVEQANPAAADLLRLCAFLHPDAIPEEIISEGAAELGSVLESVATDVWELDAAIQELRKYSLIRRDPKARLLNIHRLVQAVLKDAMEEQMQHQWAERAVRAVNRVFADGDDFKNWQQCQHGLPHAQVCAALIKQWGMKSIEAAQLLNRAGNYLRKRAQYDQAERLLTGALDICEQTLEPEHLDVARSLNDLALLYAIQGKYTQAEPLYQRALVIREHKLGLEHPDVAHSLHNLAKLYNYQGEYAQAESLFQQALVIFKKAWGSDHPDVARNLSDLAWLYYEQGKYTEAESLFQQALVICEKVLDPDHPDVALILNDLTAVYHAQSKYAQAEPLIQRALAIREKTLGSEHPDVAESLNNLSDLYHSWGKYAQAEPLIQRALAIREKTLGSEHLLVTYSLNNLAGLYRDQGKYSQAEPLYQRALAIRKKILSPDHLDVAISLSNLGALYYIQGKCDQAEPLLLQSLAIREKTFGPDNLQVTHALKHLAEVYRIQGKYAQAESILERILMIRERVLGANHPDVAQSLNSLGKVYSDQGHDTQAQPLFQRALAIREQALGPDHPDVARTLNNLAALYLAQSKYDLVEPLLQRALDIHKQALGWEHPDMLAVLENYVDLLQKTNRETEAAELKARIRAIHTRYVEENPQS
jgi:tetratricopeptide (TPR) repeat protein/transcriptional regulator with XRE-family HTH domain